jgi:hypothetical protein
MAFVIRHSWAAIVPFFFWLVLLAWLNGAFEGTQRRRKPYRFRRPDAGKWLEAPVAEVDKSSTMGKLLASQMSREPGLRVVVRGREIPSEPVSLDPLYDPEVDGSGGANPSPPARG